MLEKDFESLKYASLGVSWVVKGQLIKTGENYASYCSGPNAQKNARLIAKTQLQAGSIVEQCDPNAFSNFANLQVSTGTITIKQKELRQ